MNNETKTVLIDLGWCIGKLIVGGRLKLTIVSPMAEDENAVTPSQSIEITQLTNLITLQKALNDHLPKEEV